MTDQPIPEDFKIDDDGLPPEESAAFYRDKLTYKQLKFANLYLKYFNADKAFYEAYGEDKVRNGYGVKNNENVLGYLKARMREKEANINDLFEQSLSRLMDLADDSDKRISIEASKLIHETKLKYEDIKARYEVVKQSNDESKQQQIVVNINQLDKPK